MLLKMLLYFIKVIDMIAKFLQMDFKGLERAAIVEVAFCVSR